MRSAATVMANLPAGLLCTSVGKSRMPVSAAMASLVTSGGSFDNIAFNTSPKSMFSVLSHSIGCVSRGCCDMIASPSAGRAPMVAKAGVAGNRASAGRRA